MLRTLIQRLTFPLLLKVDFRNAIWLTSLLEARIWLVGSFVANIVSMWVIGQLTSLATLVTILGTASMWMTPVRMLLALGVLQVGISIGSLVVVIGLLAAHLHPALVQAASYLWQIWGMIATVHLILRYIRTPKAEMA